MQDAKKRAANDTGAAQQAISDALRAQDEADEVMKEAKKVGTESPCVVAGWANLGVY